MATAVWPSSALSAAERAFTLLTRPPTTLLFEARGVTGLPDRLLPVDELRTWLLSPATGADAREQVWCELVRRARRDGPAWVVATVGAATPGLRRAAARLSAGWRGDVDDLHAALVTGFVTGLVDVDLGASRVYGRLIDAAVRAARLRAGEPAPAASPARPGHCTELVAAQAAAVAVIDEAANLIDAARAGSLPAGPGIVAGSVSSWRAGAAQRLADAGQSVPPRRSPAAPGAAGRTRR